MDYEQLNQFCDIWMGTGDGETTMTEDAGKDLVPETQQREAIIHAAKQHAGSMKVQAPAMLAMAGLSPGPKKRR